jgi:hypothetical protein
MIWARRIIDATEWHEIEDQFENLFVKLGCPRQMMLVAQSGEASRALLFASLPNTALLQACAGFERIDEGDLPPDAALVIGHQDHFGRHFRPSGAGRGS